MLEEVTLTPDDMTATVNHINTLLLPHDSRFQVEVLTQTLTILATTAKAANYPHMRLPRYALTPRQWDWVKEGVKVNPELGQSERRHGADRKPARNLGTFVVTELSYDRSLHETTARLEDEDDETRTIFLTVSDVPELDSQWTITETP